MSDPALATIVSGVADRAALQVIEAAVTDLQRKPSMLSGEDSGLGMVWLEYCAQVQGEQSVDWGEFENLVRQAVDGLVRKLARVEQQALWLQTPAGEDWIEESDRDSAAIPVGRHDVVDEIYSQVWQRAADWEDEALERFLRRGDDGDDGDDFGEDDDADDDDQEDDHDGDA